MSGLPDRPDGGTHGFLFADLRGYTRLVDSLGAAEATRLLERYRLLTRDVVAHHGGAEIKTEGDSFYVVLPSASAALLCGLALVAASVDPPDGGAPIPVGVGIHAGEAVGHEGGFVGSAVNIAARLSAEAGPSELLATATIRELTRSVVDARFVALGRRTLKGLADPVDVYRVEPTLAASVGPAVTKRRIALGGLGAASPWRTTIVVGAIALAAVLAIAGASRIGRSPGLSPTSPATSQARPSASASYPVASKISPSAPLPLGWQSGGPTFSPVLSPPAITPDGQIWVASGMDGKFWIFDSTGKLLEEWGAPGHGDGQFDFIYAGTGGPFGGVAFGADGSFWVADTGNLRVQHFDRDRKLLGSWGGFGSGPGKFAEPTAISVDAVGVVYVLDVIRHDIQAFDSDGTYIKTFAAGVAGDALFVHPGGWVYTNALPNGLPGLTEYKPDTTVQDALDLTALISEPTAIAVDDQRDVFVGAGDKLVRFGTGGDPERLSIPEPDRLWPTGSESIAVTADSRAVYVTSRVSPYLRKYFLDAGAGPSPSSSGTVLLPVGGKIPPGTYTTNFQPMLTFTVDRYDPHSEAFVDQPGWIDLSFGQDPPLELFITRIDKVFDPNDPGTQIDPPPDLAAWIAKLPGLTVTARPKAVTVGGLDAEQLDIMAGDSDLAFAPIPGNTVTAGIERRHKARVIVVIVDGHEVLISFLAQEESSAHFEIAVDAFRPLVDSIDWN